MCGGSSGQKTLSADQAKFYTAMQGSYNTEFAGQTGILNTLNSVFTPIFNAGPNQQGFSDAELAARNTAARENVAADYGAAARAVGSQMAARGGGNAYLPSGVDEAVRGGIATAGARELAGEENQITQENYDVGRKNFYSAAGALGGVANTYNPSGFAGETTSAGHEAFGSATTLYNQGKAWVGALSGALGGAVSDLATGGASSFMQMNNPVGNFFK